jgi:serine/threonine protein kinase
VLAHIGDVHRQSHSATEGAPKRWGPFHLRDAVGSGSFGTVYRAWDPKLDREVAVKLLQRRPVGARSRFQEGRLLARVRHPNVVTVYGADEIDGIAGLWMEFVHGRTIKALIQEQGVFGGHEAALVGAAVGRALAAVHRAGLLHQDVKAQNVMREHGGRLVLMDFGAGVVSRDAVVPSGGTPIYMAPELFAEAPASPQSDLYSVGVLLFYMVTGGFPVEGHSHAEVRHHHAQGARRWLRDLRPDLPVGFVAAVERALDADPSRRFASAGAMELALASGDL